MGEYLCEVKQKHVDAAYEIMQTIINYGISYKDVEGTLTLVKNAFGDCVAMPNFEALERYEEYIKNSCAASRAGFREFGDPPYKALEIRARRETKEKKKSP
ncbi:MAG: hypothetical protein NC320_00890 [Clostridium sp.]|nr:hypothetical protein [Clostridium sp.]